MDAGAQDGLNGADDPHCEGAQNAASDGVPRGPPGISPPTPRIPT
jgi:hypothetical protein